MTKDFLLKSFKILIISSTLIFTALGILNDLQTHYPITFPWFFWTITTLFIGIFIVPIYLIVLYFIDTLCFYKIKNIPLRKFFNTIIIGLMTCFALCLDDNKLGSPWILVFSVIFTLLFWILEPFNHE